jgi:hypothetical protein
MIYFKPLRDGRYTSECGRFDITRGEDGAYKTRLIRAKRGGPLLKTPQLLGEAPTAWSARAEAEEWIDEHHPKEHTCCGPIVVGPSLLKAGQW